VTRVWLKYRNVLRLAMSSVLSIISILALIALSTINLNMMMVHAEDLP
jgi:hypothetical protein